MRKMIMYDKYDSCYRTVLDIEDAKEKLKKIIDCKNIRGLIDAIEWYEELEELSEN